MEYSDSITAEREEKQAGYHRHAVVRALLSASIFGTLGAIVGRWLGHHGNDPTSNLAEPMTKWSMGIFCGTLAAYSSFKASERIEKAESNACERRDADLPKTTAQVNSVTCEGKVVNATAHVALEK
jgi:hypothetical protein